MAQIPLTERERVVALRIVEMLRAECKNDLITAVKALAFANMLFQSAFRNTVENMIPERQAQFKPSKEG
jgi:hypothetical protein